jgi:hypothetical protein
MNVWAYKAKALARGIGLPKAGLRGSNAVNADGEALSRFATEGLCCLASL